MIHKARLSGAAFAGMFVFGIVMALLGAILPLISERIRFNLAQAGNLFFAMNLAMFASTLSQGPLTDRFGIKPAMGAGALFVTLALLVLARAATYPAVLVSAVLLGIGGGALNATTNTLVADLHTDPKEKSSALSVLGVFFGAGALFLPFVIGSLLKILGLVPIIYAAAVLSLVPAIFVLALAFPPPKQKEGLPLAEIPRFLRMPLVLALAFLLFFESGNEFILAGFTTTYLARDLHFPISTASYCLTGYWGAIIVGRIACSRVLLRMSGVTLVLLSALGTALGVGILLSAATGVAAALAMVLIGLSIAGIYPAVLGLAGTRFREYSGTVFGILFSIALTGGMLLPWTVGRLAQAHGLRIGLAITIGNALMIFVLQLLVSLPRHREERSSW